MIEQLYALSSAALVVAGFALVGMAIRAYLQTARRAMIHLSLGFTLVVAAAIATTVSAFMNDFESVRSLLLVNTLISTIGYIFVIYSLISYS